METTTEQNENYEQLLFEQIKQLNEKLSKSGSISKSNIRTSEERLAELEIKMSKLWDLLITNNNVKKEDRLTPTGKRFGSALLKQ